MQKRQGRLFCRFAWIANDSVQAPVRKAYYRFPLSDVNEFIVLIFINFGSQGEIMELLDTDASGCRGPLIIEEGVPIGDVGERSKDEDDGFVGLRIHQGQLRNVR